MNRWVGLGLLLIAFGALGLRGPRLGLRPMHNDEAVNAVKIRDLWQSGHYRYDPNEHHGPSLYYATLPFVWLSGAPDYDHLSESTLRAVSVFFGLVLILLLWPLTDGLGRAPVLIAAVFTAISPAMVFYSRYFIHELLLVCFTQLVILAGWRYRQHPTVGWAALAGVGLGLMYATKETFAIATAALTLSLVLAAVVPWRNPQPAESRLAWNWSHALVAVLAAAGVSVLLFTSFFTNAAGPLDSVRTYLPWLKRAGGDSPHIHPWYFYLERLIYFKEKKGPVWSEGLIVGLAVVGGVASMVGPRAWGGNRGLARFLALYSFILLAAYSAIGYKTPWCMLGFLHGLILLAGIGTMVLIRACPRRDGRIALGLILVAGAVQLTWQAWKGSYPFAADRRNPYVYAQTLPDLLRLVAKVQDLARFHPDGNRMLVKVMAPDSDYWPLPWYLRQFKQVGWSDGLLPDPYAPVMIVGAKLRAALDDKSDKAWLMVGYFELRPQTFLELYVHFDLWQKYVENRPPAPE